MLELDEVVTNERVGAPSTTLPVENQEALSAGADVGRDKERRTIVRYVH